MRLGVNVSFLRKPGTGIGVVTRGFLAELFQELGGRPDLEVILYAQEDFDRSLLPSLPERVTFRTMLPAWHRDDLLRIYLWERFSLPRAVRRDGCDAFLSLYQSATLLPDIPHTVVVHDIIPEIMPEYQGNLRQRFYWRAVRASITRAKGIVAVSQSTKADLEEFLGVSKERVRICHPALAPAFGGQPSAETCRETLSRYGLEPGYLYHGGGLEIRKNTRLVIEAYALLAKKLGDTLPPLVISGTIHPGSNPLAFDVRQAVSEAGLGERVKLLGFVPESDLPALYRAAKLFLYPSAYEGFGLPVLESLAMGTAVITARSSSLEEVGGNAAEYIETFSAQSLAAATESLLANSDRRDALELLGPEQAKKFSWSDFVGCCLMDIA